jgi:hypothetical protein
MREASLFWGEKYILVEQKKETFMKKIVTSLAVIAVFSGCAMFAPKMDLDDPNLYDQYLTRSYDEPVETCFNAVKAAFAENHVALTKEDAENGRIVTEKHEAFTYTTQSGNNRGLQNKMSHRYYIDVKGDENSCTIKVTKYKVWNNGNEMTWCKPKTIAAYYWDPLFKSFQDHFDPDADE